ncbi:hypothetical protein F1654_06380 [Alkalicaulis satelles]|uniref:DUF2987 domain-containing protein n=1 Tax=Alkalicaulis satelles TaxID=2609175 RepID=A0A5M6ZMC9_9PROT|nr:hypothetical protein [Alkalicaulis satelles]KAA5803431.1 hypothetical protein F1654_06380 [Alkalicaulis satelles]
MIAALAMALALAGTPVPDARIVPAERVFAFWSQYNALPEEERNAFTLRYGLGGTGPGGEDWRFWTALEGEDWVEITPGPEGVVTPPDPDRLAAGLRLATDAPQGAVRAEVQFALSAAPARVYALEELQAALAQSRAALRRQLGLRALIAPRPRRIDFTFEGPAPDAFAVFADGRELELTSVFENVIQLDPGARELRGAQTIRFARAPLHAVIVVAN